MEDRTTLFSKGSMLSNFYMCEVVYNGLLYKNSEAAFQAQKTLNNNIRIEFSKISSPSEAKKLGRTVQLRKDWEEVKYNEMCKIVAAKVSRNPRVKAVLMRTKGTIIEDTTGWHDNIWGACYCDKCRSKQHLNLLGKALTNLRESISYMEDQQQ